MVNPDEIGGRLGNRMFQLAYIIAQAEKGEIPDIYVQDEKYFASSADTIKKLFSTGIGFTPYVGIHIRRGDYVSNTFYVDLCDTHYYHKAIELFPNKKFLVFSDDAEFAQEFMSQFTDITYQVIEGGTEIEDMNLLASCEHVIMANSSFSWWAGYLGQNPNRKVIYPSQWYSDGITRTVCPATWTAL